MNFKQMQTKKAEGGFTLIELMIVVAIIGILAAVAIPAYQNYVAKSKFAAALAEVSGGKTGYDVKMNEGGAPADVAEAGLSATATTNCEFSLVTEGGGGIACEIQGGPGAAQGTITLNRSDAGAWTCETDIAEEVRGTTCNAAG